MKLLVILMALLGADVKLSSPETAPVSQPVLIDASDSVGDVTFDTADEHLVIFAAIRGKQALVLRKAPGIGRFTVTAKDSAGTATIREVIEFTGESPAPAPPPVEPNDTPRKLPDGKFKVAQGSHDHAQQVKVTKREQRKAESEAVAKQLESLRDKIKSKEIDPANIDVLKAEIHKATGSLPRDVQSRWSAWGSWWGNLIIKLFLGGSLKSAADWITFLEETILGLRAVL